MENNFIHIMIITMQNYPLPLRDLHLALSKLPIYKTAAWADIDIRQALCPLGLEGTMELLCQYHSCKWQIMSNIFSGASKQSKKGLMIERNSKWMHRWGWDKVWNGSETCNISYLALFCILFNSYEMYLKQMFHL